MKKLLIITLATGFFVASGIHAADDRDTRVVTREDKFNNEDEKGAWSMLSYWIERLKSDEVRKIVPSRISRELKRNSPDKPSHNSTAYDIAMHNVENLKRKIADAKAKGRTPPSGGYSRPDRIMEGIAHYLMPESIIEQQDPDMIRWIRRVQAGVY